MGADLVGEVPGDRAKLETEDIVTELEKSGSVVARLDHQEIGLAQNQESAMGLDRSGKMDLLPFAVRQVGLSECGCRHPTKHELLPDIFLFGLCRTPVEVIPIELRVKALPAQAEDFGCRGAVTVGHLQRCLDVVLLDDRGRLVDELAQRASFRSVR